MQFRQLTAHTLHAMYQLWIVRHLTIVKAVSHRTTLHIVLLIYDDSHICLVDGCQNAEILLDNRRGMDLRMNNSFGNSDGKMGMGLLCLVDG